MLIELQNKILLPFSSLKFEEKRHLYSVHGRFLPSVSKQIEKHCYKFEADKIIGRKGETLIELSAAKQSRIQGKVITVHELRHDWQTKAKDGCELGTETHDYLEYYNGLKTPTTPQQIAGVKFLTWLFSVTYIDANGKLKRRYDIVAKELRMYSKRYWIAGTADLIVADNLTRTVVIFDYKTNKDLWKTFGYLKAPFDYLESHPYNKYQLQLNYYHIFFEEMTHIKVSDRVLVHLKADATFDKYSLEDFTPDIKTYLECKDKTIYN